MVRLSDFLDAAEDRIIDDGILTFRNGEDVGKKLGRAALFEIAEQDVNVLKIGPALYGENYGGLYIIISAYAKFPEWLK